MNLIFLDTPPATDQELPTTIISRTHTETTAPTTLTSTPPHLPTNKITIHIEGVRDIFGVAYSFKKDGRRVVQLETGPPKDRYCYQNWSNLSHYVISFAVGLYNPNTGVYVKIENAGPIRIDTTHFKDISEEDVSWRAVYGEFYDFSFFMFPVLLFFGFRRGDSPIPILFEEDIKKGAYLPTWRSRFRYKWKRFLEILVEIHEVAKGGATSPTETINDQDPKMAQDHKKDE